MQELEHSATLSLVESSTNRGEARYHGSEKECPSENMLSSSMTIGEVCVS